MSKASLAQKNTIVSKGEIWLTKFHPGTGSELTKYRPALIIRHLDDIDSRFALIAPLTSSKKKNEYEVSIDHQDLRATSTVLTWYLWTIDARRLQHKIGVLDAKDMTKVTTALTKLKLNSL